MDALRFDRFARTVATRLTRRTGLGLLAGASLPLLGLASATDAKKKKKLTLCINGTTVKVSKKKAKKLLKKGAGKGACSSACPTGRIRCNNKCIPTTACCNCVPPDFCSFGLCLKPIVLKTCGDGGPCTVFVTSQSLKGDIGGLAGADAKCQAAAGNANLRGTYKAWLSDATESPASRFPATAGPWRLPRNETDTGLPPLVATNFTGLTTCGATCLKSAIDRNENGAAVSQPYKAWTNTLVDGMAGTASCQNWTDSTDASAGLFGDTAEDDSTWTNIGLLATCNSTLALYCFQVAT